MPMDGLMLREVAAELSGYIGARVERLQQPERDEVHIHLHGAGRGARLLLSASANYARAHLTELGKKSPETPPAFLTAARKHLNNARLIKVEQQGCDRVLRLVFEARSELGDMVERALILETMGRHSNLILLNETGRIIDSAHHVHADISRVRQVLPGLMYEPPPGQGKLDPFGASADALAAALNERQPLSKLLSDALQGLSMQSAREIACRIAGDEQALIAQGDAPRVAQRTLEVIRALPTEPTIVFNEEGVPQDVFPFPCLSRAGEQRRFDTPSQALDAFYAQRDLNTRLREKSHAMRSTVQNALERAQRKLQAQMEKELECARMDEYRHYGEVLTAHMGTLKRGQTSARLVDYYDENLGEIDVPLDARLSPQDNAARYFKLYAKARAALGLLGEQMRETNADITFLQSELHAIDSATGEDELNEIREELAEQGVLRRAPLTDGKRKQPARVPPTKPHMFLSPDGFEVYVGKNNRQNDALLRAAQGEDVWLHIKNAPGSHVIISAVGRSVPESTVLFAAQLAAHFSSARASDSAPIDVTLRKHVKKPGGAKPGFVIFTDQKTLTVKPMPRLP